MGVDVLGVELMVTAAVPVIIEFLVVAAFEVGVQTAMAFSRMVQVKFRRRTAGMVRKTMIEELSVALDILQDTPYSAERVYWAIGVLETSGAFEERAGIQATRRRKSASNSYSGALRAYWSDSQYAFRMVSGASSGTRKYLDSSSCSGSGPKNASYSGKGRFPYWQ